MRSVRRRFRLFSQARRTPAREALEGRTFETRKVSSRRPAMASATTTSAPPSAYISAVSISVTPRSRPSFSALTSSARRRESSPIFHVPWPRTGMASPQGSVVVLTLDSMAWLRGYPIASSLDVNPEEVLAGPA